MIRKIKKIMALVLIATSFTTIAPGGIFGIDAKATVNDSSKITLDSQNNNVALSMDPASMVPDGNTLIGMAESTTINPALEYGANLTLKAQGASSIASEECGKLSYTLSDTVIEQISNQVFSAIEGPITDAVVAQASAATGMPASVLKPIFKPIVQAKLKAALPEAIKSRFANIPLYQYTGEDSSGNIKAQAFVIKGLVGSILNTALGNGGYIVNTFNTKVSNATYNSLAPVPGLNLTTPAAANISINLNESNTKVIGDGMSINVIDSSNNKVYVINNPIYNMLKAQQGGSSYISKTLNVINFKDVNNLKGDLSEPLDVDGNKISLLSLSLDVKDSSKITNKNYKYALLVENYEKGFLDGVINDLNLGTIGDQVKSMIKPGTYTMVPDLKSDIGAIIDGSGIGSAVGKITDGLNNVSDSLNDLTDSLNDKRDDVDDAWDKVFDRFDNDKGWGKKDGYTYYYDKDGVSLKGAQKINGKTYYFNRIDGAMETGWQIVEGKKCYFDKKKGYELFTQWVQDNEDRYFLGEDGAVKKMQWVNDGGKSYYLKADGKMTKGWLKIEDYWYYFNKDGSMATSTWKWSDGKWYYLKDNGQVANDWLQLDTNWYYFKDPSGALQTGWFRANGNWYCSNDDGTMKTGWANSTDGLCYLDDVNGKMKKNEWVTVDGKSYYFNINGIMVTGSRYIDGTKYVFNSDGSLS